MTTIDYRIVTMSERPDLIEVVYQDAALDAAWPDFLQHDPVVNRYWSRMFEIFPEYQFVLLNTTNDEIIALCNSVPLVWQSAPDELPDRGLDWALTQAFADADAHYIPTTQCAVAIAIKFAYRGQGLSSVAVKAMKSISERYELDALIAPVRPTQKTLYPLTPMARYIHWMRPDGLPFDPWLRVHARLGAALVKACSESMTITGTVAEWEAWAGLQFPETGTYVVPGALTTVAVNRETNQGLYVEPNVWMRHPIR